MQELTGKHWLYTQGIHHQQMSQSRTKVGFVKHKHTSKHCLYEQGFYHQQMAECRMESGVC